jgi:hypothetical protein
MAPHVDRAGDRGELGVPHLVAIGVDREPEIDGGAGRVDGVVEAADATCAERRGSDGDCLRRLTGHRDGRSNLRSRSDGGLDACILRHVEIFH